MQKADDVLKEATQAHLAGDWPRAEYLYCRIIAHVEDHPVAYFCLGTLYAQALAPGRAITFLKRAIELDPHNHEAMANLAGVYGQMEEKQKAIAWNQKALLHQKSARVLSNIAGCYINNGTPELALKYADEALALQPNFPEAANHRALALLELGRYEEGWRQYDARMDCVGSQDEKQMTRARYTRRPFTVPLWQGEKVGKLALHGEQGLGDEILFLTCLKQLSGRWDELVIEVNPRLVALIQNSFPDAKVYGQHADLPIQPDRYLPLGSLPRLAWPVQPNAYLKPTITLPKTGQIGLSWYGGSQLTHDRLRNTFVEDWKVLAEAFDCVSLQYGPHGAEAAKLGIPHDDMAIADLDRLAARIQSCDLVVSVCNTTIHMAGALGVPCLVLVPYKPSWRYGLTGERMVWYDSVTLLRQREGEDWPSVLQRAREWVRDFRCVS